MKFNSTGERPRGHMFGVACVLGASVPAEVVQGVVSCVREKRGNVLPSTCSLCLCRRCVISGLGSRERRQIEPLHQSAIHHGSADKRIRSALTPRTHAATRSSNRLTTGQCCTLRRHRTSVVLPTV